MISVTSFVREWFTIDPHTETFGYFSSEGNHSGIHVQFFCSGSPHLFKAKSTGGGGGGRKYFWVYEMIPEVKYPIFDEVNIEKHMQKWRTFDFPLVNCWMFLLTADLFYSRPAVRILLCPVSKHILIALESWSIWMCQLHIVGFATRCNIWHTMWTKRFISVVWPRKIWEWLDPQRNNGFSTSLSTMNSLSSMN